MNIKKIRAYIKVWIRLTVQQFQIQIANSRFSASLFIIGKLFRLTTAFMLVYVVTIKAGLIAGYTLNQAILILLIFNLTSTIAQLFLRGVYIFRQKVIDGTFDFYLLNPLSELFYSLFSQTDPIDLLLLIPYVSITLWAWLAAGYSFTVINLLLFSMSIFLALLIVVSWHIFIIAIGVKYLEVDNAIMLYRDLEKMGSFPVSMYGNIGENILTYILPFALLASIPADVIFGNFNPIYLFIFLLIAIFQLKISLWYWNFSLKSYSSASS